MTLAALRGGAGKTFVSVGMAAAYKARGCTLSVFKKGPDYIDAAWLSLVAGSLCRNLDAYLAPTEAVKDSFVRAARGSDLALVEGNRGLFDGVDHLGSFSTAELAKLLQSPVLLVVDATKMTRTAAALVLGCRLLDPELNIAGVILNRVAGARHERVVREAIHEVTGLPVLGSVGKVAADKFPQRHLGLLSAYEHPRAEAFLGEAGRVIADSVDLDAALEIARCAPDLVVAQEPSVSQSAASKVRIGVIRDAAFQFYYPDNLEALESAGAELVFINSLTAQVLGRIDGLYIGGGFPESHAEALAANHVMRSAILESAQSGLPIYAECGGLMYLSKNLRIDEKTFPMVGLFPVDIVLERRPQGHGYIKVEVARENPFFPVGTALIGHEFHYSQAAPLPGVSLRYIFDVKRGFGIDGRHDGIQVHNTLGAYTHIHALGERKWAEGVVAAALRHRDRRGE